MRAHPIGALATAAAALFAGCGKGDCKTKQPVARVCIPDLAAPFKPLTLAAADTCTGCTFAGLSCNATIDGESGSVHLTVLTTACETQQACAAVCVRRDTSCVVPPMMSGDWPVTVNGALVGTLRVGAGGTETCMLPDVLP